MSATTCGCRRCESLLTGPDPLFCRDCRAFFARVRAMAKRLHGKAGRNPSRESGIREVRAAMGTGKGRDDY